MNEKFKKLASTIKRQIMSSGADVDWHREIDPDAMSLFNSLASDLFGVDGKAFEIFLSEPKYRPNSQAFFDELEIFNAEAPENATVIRSDVFRYRRPFNPANTLQFRIWTFEKKPGTREWRRIVSSVQFEEGIESQQQKMINVIDDWIDFAEMNDPISTGGNDPISTGKNDPIPPSCRNNGQQSGEPLDANFVSDRYGISKSQLSIKSESNDYIKVSRKHIFKWKFIKKLAE